MPVAFVLALLCAQGAPTVTAMDPSPNSTRMSPVAVTITLSQTLNPATVSSATVTLVGRGPDLAFGTGDDLTITPASIGASGNVITLDLTGQTLPDDVYRLRLSGSPATPAAVSGLFAHWTLNEASGTSVLDASGNGRTGTLNGAVRTTGLFGNALRFNAGDNRVDIDAGVVTPNWTAALWVHRSADVLNTAATLVDCIASATGTSLRLEQFVAANQVGITEYTTVDHGFGYVLPLNTWTHLTFTSDGSNARLYVNGSLQATAPRAFNLHVDKLGSATTVRTNSLNGLLDEVQIYSRVLTTGEISGLATLAGGIRDAAAHVLDGEFLGSLPSGNGSGGGDFVASFTVSATPPPVQTPVVTALDPPPGSVRTSPPAVAVTLSHVPTGVSPSTVSLIGRGPDSQFGTADDLAVSPASLIVSGTSILLDLTGQTLPDDVYQVRLSVSPSPPAAVSGLFGHWRMNETAGSQVSDSSGNGRHGTLNGAGLNSGLFGNSLQLDGGASRVDIDAGVMSPGWSAALWVWLGDNTTTAASTVIDSNSSTGTSLQLEQFNTGFDVGITEYTVVNYGFGYFLPLDTWVHLVYTSDATNAHLYVNGTLVDTAPRAFNLHVDKLGTARTSVSLSPICLLDEVQIYGRVLTGPEISSLAALVGGIRSGSGGVLDGEFFGGFPSGNGVGGGDFVANFTVSGSALNLVVEGCGLLSPEFLIPLGVLVLLRRRMRKAR